MTEQEILEAITKSGYLFESEIVKFLSGQNFFVESNVVFKDPITLKSREIDIVAETYNEYREGISSKIRYFFELKNNSFPLVLLTELQFNPNTPEQLIKEIVTVPTNMQYDPSDGYWESLQYDGLPLFTQYCSFTKKNNNQIMASHPDELYSSLNKLCWYCEDEFLKHIDIFSNMNNKYFRHWLYLPILLINDDLYQLTVENNNSNLKKVLFSKLLVNFYYDDSPTSTIVYIVTKSHLKDFLQEMNMLELQIANKMSDSNP
ncbi:hypothetical protein [Epilithonimonas sp. UC225_85]|uniref:hypothetical protein n=1 Tax=Epilithonimonas sp. UC225_85 TaxID=3350167 RepID=UPI0036D4242A